MVPNKLLLGTTLVPNKLLFGTTLVPNKHFVKFIYYAFYIIYVAIIITKCLLGTSVVPNSSLFGTILFPFVVPTVFKLAIWVFPPIFSSTLVPEMAFTSHYVFLHYITLHYIYVTLHHVTSHYIYLYVFIFNLGAISVFSYKAHCSSLWSTRPQGARFGIHSGLTHLVRG